MAGAACTTGVHGWEGHRRAGFVGGFRVSDLQGGLDPAPTDNVPHCLCLCCQLGVDTPPHTVSTLWPACFGPLWTVALLLQGAPRPAHAGRGRRPGEGDRGAVGPGRRVWLGCLVLPGRGRRRARPGKQGLCVAASLPSRHRHPTVELGRWPKVGPLRCDRPGFLALWGIHPRCLVPCPPSRGPRPASSLGTGAPSHQL